MSALSRAAGLTCALVLLAGCHHDPPEHDEVVKEALPKEVIRGDWSAGKGPWSTVARGAKVQDAWLKSFGDPVLDGLVAEGLKHNLMLRGVAARVAAATGAARLAGAKLKPVIGVGGGASVGALAGLNRNDGFGAAAQGSWEIDVWGRLHAIAEAGEEELAAAEADFEFARQSLAGLIAKSWWFCAEIQLHHGIAEEAVKLAEEAHAIVRAQRRAGRAREQDVLQAEAEVHAARERTLQAEGALEQARRALELLLGRYPAAELEVRAGFPQLPGPVPAGLPSALLERRFDLVAAERRVRAQFLRTKAAKLAHLPQITLSAQGGLSSKLDDLLRQGPEFWSVGANFYQPVYTGGAIEAAVEIETAKQEAALASYGQKALVAFGEVENALGNERLYAKREGHLRKVLGAEEGNLRVAESAHRTGKVGKLALIQARGRLLGARSLLVEIQGARLVQRVELHMVLGGSFELPKRAKTEPASTKSD
jgi:multidrug efflux system outer membrane protein